MDDVSRWSLLTVLLPTRATPGLYSNLSQPGVGVTEHVVVVTVMNSINTSTLTCKRLNEKTVGLDHTGSSFPDV
ncbi:hypothetical protein V1478_003531 [Vespula squamosa]|uniref:Secreted protein n=1 Tax=Vespula squamosa TaxID=30214 RepID=A0ABD2BNA7_VESSQ